MPLLLTAASLAAHLPAAIRAFNGEARDDRDADSPGGAKRTAGEVAEDFAAFLKVFADLALPDVLHANGHPRAGP